MAAVSLSHPPSTDSSMDKAPSMLCGTMDVPVLRAVPANSPLEANLLGEPGMSPAHPHSSSQRLQGLSFSQLRGPNPDLGLWDGPCEGAAGPV